jgi:hypothetical protein
MTKRAAQRLARLYRRLGYRIKIRQHKSRAGVFYSFELAPKKRPKDQQ